MTATSQSFVRAGDLLHIGKAASVQFAGKGRSFNFRVIRTHDWPTTCDGWVWLDGYQLNAAGDAIERRSIFVRPEGFKPYQQQAGPSPRPLRRR